MTARILADKKQEVMISSYIEQLVQNEVSEIHFFIQQIKAKEINPTNENIAQKINIASNLWLVNQKLRYELVSPLEKLLFEIKGRFDPRADLLVGAERFLKNILIENGGN